MAEIWQEEIRSSVCGSDLSAVESRYQTRVPRYYLGLIDASDPADPIARMALPSAEELLVAGGRRDPIGDLDRKAAPRLTHRYRDRALLHVTNLCPMYCRFCFRKNLMNESEPDLYSGSFDEAFAYLSAHSEIEELILTGGDPWMLSDEKLGALLDRVEREAPSVRRLRFHTRMPVTLPSRVTDGLVSVLARGARFRIFVVTHFNHPRELTAAAAAAVARLRAAGFVVLNQSVLLRDVNDSAETLRALFVGLGDWGVLPYYLHHCDQVEGAEHFRLTLREGRALYSSLRGKLAGYLLPEYVLDLPGGLGKVPVGESFLLEDSGESYSVRTSSGSRVSYRDAGTPAP